MCDFNKESVYDNEIAELVEQIKRICSREKMPMFITVCTQNSKDGTVYRNDMISAATHNVALTDDRIPRFVNVTLGFNTVPPVEIPEIEFE